MMEKTRQEQMTGKNDVRKRQVLITSVDLKGEIKIYKTISTLNENKGKDN